MGFEKWTPKWTPKGLVCRNCGASDPDRGDVCGNCGENPSVGPKILTKAQLKIKRVMDYIAS